MTMLCGEFGCPALAIDTYKTICYFIYRFALPFSGDYSGGPILGMDRQKFLISG